MGLSEKRIEQLKGNASEYDNSSEESGWVHHKTIITDIKSDSQCSVPAQLPTVTLDNGKTYFIDERLKQLRNVDNPHDFIDF